MKCPHCAVMIQPNWCKGNINLPSTDEVRPEDYGHVPPGPHFETAWGWAATRCPSCKKPIINVELMDVDDPVYPLSQVQAYPRFPKRKLVDDAVPQYLSHLGQITLRPVMFLKSAQKRLRLCRAESYRGYCRTRTTDPRI